MTAGSGYDYLTRQVAAQDATEKGAASLASYYAEKGESPGRWVGSGLAGLDGLAEGDVVTAEQMKALFGSGRHPLSEEMRARLQGPGLTAKDFDLISRLGVPYKVYAGDVSAFRSLMSDSRRRGHGLASEIGRAGRQGAARIDPCAAVIV